MSATENIPVSKKTYNEILDLRLTDETLDETLARLVDRIKKQRLTDESVSSKKTVAARSRTCEGDISGYDDMIGQ